MTNTLLQHDKHIDTMWQTLCYSVTNTLLQHDKHIDTMWQTLCYSVTNTLSQHEKLFVTVWQTLCYSVTNTLLQSDKHFVTVWQTLCYSVTNTLLQSDKHFVTVWIILLPLTMFELPTWGSLKQHKYQLMVLQASHSMTCIFCCWNICQYSGFTKFCISMYLMLPKVRLSNFFSDSFNK